MSELTIREKIYNAIHDDNTWDDLADGIEIKFQYNGKEYSFNSKVVSHPMITPLDGYMDKILNRGVALVKE